MKKYVNILFMCSLAISSGCTSFKSPQSYTIENFEISEDFIVPYNSTPKNPADAVNKQAPILYSIVNSLLDGSSYKKAHRYETAVTELNDVKGVTLTQSGFNISLIYVNGQYHVMQNIELSTKVSAVYKFNFIDSGSFFIVRVTYPSQFTINQSRDGLYRPIPPLDDLAQLSLDVKKINKNLSKELHKFEKSKI